MSLTLLIGGARSGKSALAVAMGRRHPGDVVYVATAPIVDEDMAGRVDRHRSERPPAWTTIEEPLALSATLGSCPPDAMVVIDCLTLWVSNLMWEHLDDEEIDQRAGAAADVAGARPGPVVAITNEVGLGVHPETPLGRRYRDVLGRVNQRWAVAAATSLLLVAGRALPLGDPWQHLQDGSAR